MASAIEVLNHRLSLAMMVLALVASGLAFMDSRHASAMDVQQLTDQIEEGRIDDLEYKISETERRIKQILLIPEEERDVWDLRDLTDNMDRKEYLLRKLNRLMSEAAKRAGT